LHADVEGDDVGDFSGEVYVGAEVVDVEFDALDGEVRDTEEDVRWGGGGGGVGVAAASASAATPAAGAAAGGGGRRASGRGGGGGLLALGGGGGLLRGRLGGALRRGIAGAGWWRVGVGGGVLSHDEEGQHQEGEDLREKGEGVIAYHDGDGCCLGETVISKRMDEVGGDHCATATQRR